MTVLIVDLLEMIDVEQQDRGAVARLGELVAQHLPEVATIEDLGEGVDARSQLRVGMGDLELLVGTLDLLQRHLELGETFIGELQRLVTAACRDSEKGGDSCCQSKSEYEDEPWKDGLECTQGAAGNSHGPMPVSDGDRGLQCVVESRPERC